MLISPSEEAGLLRLKPRQCLLIVDDTFLMLTGGPFLLENVYLKAVQYQSVYNMALVTASHLSYRQELVNLWSIGETTFAEVSQLAVGPPFYQDDHLETGAISAAELFLVNVTMQLAREMPTSAFAVSMSTLSSSLYMQGMQAHADLSLEPAVDTSFGTVHWLGLNLRTLFLVHSFSATLEQN